MQCPFSYLVSSLAGCKENGKAERDNSPIDHPDMRGLDTADQWVRLRACLSLGTWVSRLASTWVCLEDSPYRGIPPDSADPFHGLQCCSARSHAFHPVCPTIAPQMKPASSRATAVAATCGGRFAYRRRQNFLFRRFPARSA